MVIGAGIMAALDVGWPVGWLLALVVLFSYFLPLALVFPVTYTIHEERLDVRGGQIRWRIPLADILEVRPSRNPLSSPALSLDRLRVNYRKGARKRYVLISPAQKEAFLRELARCEPGLLFDGKGLVRSNPVI